MTFENHNSAHDSDNDLVTPTKLQDFLFNSRFNKVLETILHKNPQCYFMMLAQEGIKLPSDFNASKIVEENNNQEDIGASRHRHRDIPRSKSP